MGAPCEKGSVVVEQQAVGYLYLIVDIQGNVVKSRYLGVNTVNNLLTSPSEAWCGIKDAALTCPVHMTDEDCDFSQRDNASYVSVALMRSAQPTDIMTTACLRVISYVLTQSV